MAGLRASTVAPGSTAPELSLTVPSMEARVSCAIAELATSRSSATHTLILLFISPPELKTTT
jgi:hypothetical protein